MKNIIEKFLISNNINTNIENYSFLDEDSHNIILLGLGGSYAYGTNIEGSDIDIRGIAVNTPQEILMGEDFEQICDVTTDTTIYSLKKMCSLLANCNPNCIEILGLDADQYIYLSDIGRRLIENKDMFLSKRCINSFMGYANQQMYRLQQKSLVAMSESDLNAHVCKTLHFMKEELKNKYDITNVNFQLDSNGKIIMNLHVDNYPIEDLSNMLGIFNKTIRDYNKNSVRNAKAIAHGKINKHAMHLLRLYMMCEDILLYGEINTHRVKEHDLLMSIRNGEYTNEDGKPNAEFYDIVHSYESRIAQAKKKTCLPDQPNIIKIRQFLMDVNLETVK